MWQSIEGTKFFKEIEDIWDEIVYISRKSAYEMKVETLGFQRLRQGLSASCLTDESSEQTRDETHQQQKGNFQELKG